MIVHDPRDLGVERDDRSMEWFKLTDEYEKKPVATCGGSARGYSKGPPKHAPFQQCHNPWKVTCAEEEITMPTIRGIAAPQDKFHARNFHCRRVAPFGGFSMAYFLPWRLSITYAIVPSTTIS